MGASIQLRCSRLLRFGSSAIILDTQGLPRTELLLSQQPVRLSERCLQLELAVLPSCSCDGCRNRSQQ